MSTRKLRASGRDVLERLRGKDPSTVVSMLLRARAALSPSELKALADDGVRVRTQAGDVISADVAVGAVDRVLAHDFIVSCELSQPLYPESASEPGGDAE